MYKYSVILGNLRNTCDRFCKGYKENPSTEEMLAQAAKIPYVEGIELVGTWDIRPDNVKEMKKRMEELGICIDTGHGFCVGENVVEAVILQTCRGFTSPYAL